MRTNSDDVLDDRSCVYTLLANESSADVRISRFGGNGRPTTKRKGDQDEGSKGAWVARERGRLRAAKVISAHGRQRRSWQHRVCREGLPWASCRLPRRAQSVRLVSAAASRLCDGARRRVMGERRGPATWKQCTAETGARRSQPACRCFERRSGACRLHRQSNRPLQKLKTAGDSAATSRIVHCSWPVGGNSDRAPGILFSHASMPPQPVPGSPLWNDGGRHAWRRLSALPTSSSPCGERSADSHSTAFVAYSERAAPWYLAAGPLKDPIALIRVPKAWAPFHDPWTDHPRPPLKRIALADDRALLRHRQLDAVHIP
ncbi:hypothetical protein PSPO01_02496 [Paraphaeosphaeria sporulosa]